MTIGPLVDNSTADRHCHSNSYATKLTKVQDFKKNTSNDNVDLSIMTTLSIT